MSNKKKDRMELGSILRGCLPSNDNVKNKPEVNKTWLLIGLMVFILAVVVVFNLGNKQVLNNSLINSGTINIDQQPPLRYWKELSMQERSQIKQEAIKKFPKIKNIGKGVSWKPITEWLIRDKKIVHTNPRGLFTYLKKDAL